MDSFTQSLPISLTVGYKAIAINRTTELKGSSKKNPVKDNVKASDLKVPEDVISGGKEKGVKQYTRITFELEEPAGLNKLGSAEYLEYDLMAVEPKNEKMFLRACSSIEVDIITLKLDKWLPFKLRRAQVWTAVKRGVFFEICYSQAFADAASRQMFISSAIELTNYCRGRNIILSSGCTKAIHMRGPNDVVALGHLFNMTEEQAKAAVTTNCKAVIMHGQMRHFAKSTISMIPLKDLDPKDEWKITACKDYRKNKRKAADVAGPKKKKAKS